MSKITTYSPIEEQILERYAQGFSRKDIAFELDLPLKSVNQVFNKPNIKDKLQEIVEHRELLLKAKHSEILNELTDNMLENSEEVTDLLNKRRDILDVIQTTSTLLKDQEKKRLNAGSENIIVNILNKLS